MSDFLRQYLTVAIFGGIAVGLLAVVLWVGSLIRPHRAEGDHYTSYESGVDPVGTGWAQSPIRYYVFALLFVLFDVEAVFIFPWATQLEVYGWFGAIEMIVFIGLLALGLSTPGARECSSGSEMDPGRRPLMGLVESGKMPKPLTNLLNVSRKYSLWIFQWGLACCAIEMGVALGGPRYDVMRLGVIPLPASPRQADLVCISGTVTDKMVPSIQRLYEQMPDPKYVISMGVLRQLRRALLGQLLRHQGRRPDHPRRRLRARLPAAARGAAGGHRAPPGPHPPRGHGRALEG